MTHREKVDLLRADFARRNPSLSVAPPFVRMLWALGVDVPPTLFWRPVALAALYGSLGLFLGGLLWLSDWLPDGPAIRAAIIAGITALYALWGVWFYRRKARALNLPSWKDYPAPDSDVKPS